MDIVAALFIDTIDLRQVPGPVDPHRPHRHPVLGAGARARPRSRSSRTSWSSSAARPTRPAPAPSRSSYQRDGEQIARNVQPLQVEPGKFNYRLVRAELEFETLGTIEAHCRVDLGPVTVVPYTLLPPVD